MPTAFASELAVDIVQLPPLPFRSLDRNGLPTSAADANSVCEIDFESIADFKFATNASIAGTTSCRFASIGM